MKPFNFILFGIKWHVQEGTVDTPDLAIGQTPPNADGEYTGYDGAMCSETSQVYVLNVNKDDRKNMSLLHEVFEIISYDLHLELSESDIKGLTAGINEVYTLKIKKCK